MDDDEHVVILSYDMCEGWGCRLASHCVGAPCSLVIFTTFIVIAYLTVLWLFKVYLHVITCRLKSVDFMRFVWSGLRVEIWVLPILTSIKLQSGSFHLFFRGQGFMHGLLISCHSLESDYGWIAILIALSLSLSRHWFIMRSQITFDSIKMELNWIKSHVTTLLSCREAV